MAQWKARASSGGRSSYASAEALVPANHEDVQNSGRDCSPGEGRREGGCVQRRAARFFPEMDPI
jgi:hypothetical protein